MRGWRRCSLGGNNGDRRSNAELDHQANEETKSGFGVPIVEVKAWVESWDTEHELPLPKGRKIW